MQATNPSPARADADAGTEPLVRIQTPDESRSLSGQLAAIEADPQGLADIQRFAPAFLLWENGFRANPNAFMSADEVAALDSTDLATQSAAYFVLCLRSAAACGLVVLT